MLLSNCNCNLLFTFSFEMDPVVGPSVCGGVAYGIRPVVAALPSWFRFAQCLRRYRDTRLAFPHLVNAGKYATTFFVVIFSTLHSIYKGTICRISVGSCLSELFLHMFSFTVYSKTWPWSK